MDDNDNATSNAISITIPSSQSGDTIDHGHIVIPLMIFVFAFPVIVIAVLCAIQQRNKWLAYRQRQEHRGSLTGSTMYSAVTSLTAPRHKSSIASSVVDMNAVQPKRRDSIALCVFPEVSPDSSGFALEAAEIVAENAHDRNDQENISAAKSVTDI